MRPAPAATGLIVGTPGQIADALQDRFDASGAGGFNIMPLTLPGGLDDLAAPVIPELQRRGLFRQDYEGRTLRENLGLPRPADRFSAPIGAGSGRCLA